MADLATNCVVHLPWQGFILPNIISLSSYDIVEMPRILQMKKPREWSRNDAREYFEWLMSLKPARIKQLLAIAEVSSEATWGEISSSIASVLTRSLDNLGEISDGGLRANGLGLVAGFDAALVIGDRLVTAMPGVSWGSLRTEVKYFISANLGVVHRGESITALEPFLEGRTLLTLAHRNRNVDGYDFINEKYQHWRERLMAPT
jgi:hypothetical protein